MNLRNFEWCHLIELLKNRPNTNNFQKYKNPRNHTKDLPEPFPYNLSTKLCTQHIKAHSRTQKVNNKTTAKEKNAQYTEAKNNGVQQQSRIMA